MIDVERILHDELDRLVAIDDRPDWDEVIARAAAARRHAARRRLLVTLVALAAAGALGLATPFGAALVRTLDDFSAWVAGRPGAPVSEEEQRQFEAANARSWLGFPRGTELRRLTTREVDGVTFELLGFRSGSSSLCLRLDVIGKSRTSKLECAPLDELRRDGGPVRVVLADHSIGKGDKRVWYGIDRFHSARFQVTAGIAADGVESVVLEDDAGRHEVPVAGSAFLYVATEPDVGQRVRAVWARTAVGLMAVPFVPTPWGLGARPTAPAAAPPAPTVERELDGGRIGWLERREPRGEPLDVLPARARRVVLGERPGRRPGKSTNVLFGRVLTPDPGRPLRLVVTLNAHRPGGPAAGLCTWFVSRSGGAGGGCAPYPDVFEQTPINYGGRGGGASAFTTLEGLVSDDVARIEALTAGSERVRIPLVDNAFVVDLPRTKLPARLVAYDADGRVVGVGDALHDFGGGPAPARGRAESLFRASGPNGSSAELLVGPSDQGGECMWIKHFVDRTHRGNTMFCGGSEWTGPPLQVHSQFTPPRFVGGRVRDDIVRVRIRFADGAAVELEPRRGYLLYAVPAERLTTSRRAVGAEGVDAGGRVVGRTSFEPPRR